MYNYYRERYDETMRQVRLARAGAMAVFLKHFEKFEKIGESEKFNPGSAFDGTRNVLRLIAKDFEAVAALEERAEYELAEAEKEKTRAKEKAEEEAEAAAKEGEDDAREL